MLFNTPGWWAETIIEPAEAMLTLTGGVPDVVVTENNLITPEPASLTITGGVPTIGQTVRPAAAQLTLTGGVPTVINGKVIEPTPAHLTLTGGTPTIVQTIRPAPAVLTLTGGVPTVTVATPITVGTVGTPGSENTGDLTCSITPASGEDVLVFAWCIGSASSCYKGVYGASPMKCLGRVKLNSGTLTAFLIENVSSGSATVTISKSGSDWAQAVALSYANAVDFRQVKVAKGSGTTASQSATPGASARSIGSFTRGGISGNFTSPTGGTNRLNDSSGFVAGTVSDTSTSATFSASISSSANWGGVVVDALTAAILTPRINYTGGIWSEVNGGTQTFTVKAAVNDYIVVDMVQSGGGDPSSVTCAGVAMTLVDTQAFTHPNTSSGFLKRYRSAQITSAGDKTISITATGSQWWRAAGCSISNVTSFGATTKGAGTSSSPAQSVSCSADQLILQSFVTSSAPTELNASNIFDSPGGSQLYLLMNTAEEATAFSIPNSMNWACMATVVS
ncbi:hypothetical protein [Mycobacteroides abscessus]|uniref:hypothetical protein n=1 Tax=Mycobacteroides abscessus TaxID=36809 RepID=UPI00092779FA|nr:hypothetical protein [Mycobacteroides abscessus]MDO3201213.1 hypothetical protein [Mycobacteroides abscessus subsp. abscessus]SHY28767.1 Bacteriophage protein [Mycobacteroides abscessus subsp. abscessus]SHY45117.1 Bacteriophage protein [Mycobacteroides abscessus subsp. abscessus]